MTFIGRSFRLLKGTLGTALLFEAVYKVLLVLIVVPLEYGILDLTLLVQGYAYLADVNLVNVLLCPITWIAATVMVALMAVYSLMEICALITLSHASHNGQKLRLREVFSLAAADAGRVLRRGNLGAVFFVLLLIPFTNLALTSSAVSSIHIPEFITDHMMETAPLALVYLALTIFLCIIAIRLVFSLHFFTLGHTSFREGCRKSTRLLHGHYRYYLWRLAMWTIVISVITGLLTAGLLAPFILRYVDGQANHDAATIISVAQAAFVAALACFTTPLNYCFLTDVFYRLLEKTGEAEPEPVRVPEKTIGTQKPLSWVVSCLLLGAVALTLGARMVYSDWQCLDKAVEQGAGACEVTAHRGGSLTAPENTLDAFQSAIDQGADWVELDVQQTADGVLIVMHDSNLKRTTGVDANIWDVTYSEIENLDNGSFFSSEYSETRICTLEQALSLCKDKVKMNIEVKPDGHGADLEKKTVDLINEYDMADQVAVASISYDSLTKVKEYDPDITTMYDMVLAYGDISQIPDVDIYSVDEAFVTPSLTARVDGNGKRIFAWTVNENDNMIRMYLYGVGSIVTDQVQDAEDICR